MHAYSGSPKPFPARKHTKKPIEQFQSSFCHFALANMKSFAKLSTFIPKFTTKCFLISTSIDKITCEFSKYKIDNDTIFDKVDRSIKCCSNGFFIHISLKLSLYIPYITLFFSPSVLRQKPIFAPVSHSSSPVTSLQAAIIAPTLFIFSASPFVNFLVTSMRPASEIFPFSI